MLMSSRFCVACFCAICLSSAFSESASWSEVGAQHRLLAQAERLGQSARPRRSSGRARRPGLRPDRRRIAPRRPYPLRSARRGGVSDLLGLRCLHRSNRIAAARDLREAGVQRVRGAAHVGAGFGRIQLQQQVARLDCLAGLDVNRGDLAGIERLDHFGIAGGLDLAGRDGVDVEPAEKRPCQGDDGESAQIVAISAIGNGGGGVSRISSAAGRNSRSRPETASRGRGAGGGAAEAQQGRSALVHAGALA